MYVCVLGCVVCVCACVYVLCACVRVACVVCVCVETGRRPGEIAIEAQALGTSRACVPPTQHSFV